MMGVLALGALKLGAAHAIAFDVDACPAAARRHAVSSVPTVLAVCDGTEVARTGPLPRAALEQFVERARASRG